jgi:hypothetical protein
MSEIYKIWGFYRVKILLRFQIMNIMCFGCALQTIMVEDGFWGNVTWLSEITLPKSLYRWQGLSWGNFNHTFR